ncbi:MAG: prolipoprotein diacylglyceryl transferase [Candidatus Omnitrophota bacterium]
MYPILFEIGSLSIRSYGVLVAAGFAIGFSLLYIEAKRKNFYPEKILDLEFLILLSGVIGARLLHVFVNLNYYTSNPLEMLFLWRGGLAIYGGIIFAIAASWIFIARKGMPLWKTADFIIPYVALGQAIGRIGCWFNGCCYGKPINALLNHPTQLYASFALIVIFIILKLAAKKSYFSGFVFMLYLVLYSGQRFFIDFLRDDTPRYYLNLTVSQFISIAVLVFAFGFYITRQKNK